MTRIARALDPYDILLNPSAFLRADLTQELTSGARLTDGRRAMGEPWEVEAIR